ncbi:hypothetical protein SAMN05421759_102273 [Roseivivax lentus]|uniref:Uncharacterized protein n=1 Tax=Roseivivax lentus TaxID=633194 RepID=A0A1N7L114_9RHOB|nr:hypothetical protein [Roseivivax lentus]SIS67539.1 hypothetical protein SAMN05421759_102273 [Roseivivax lentus]
MALIISAILFGIFVIDVGFGSLGGRAFLSDVQAMILLLASSIAFVTAILRREAEAKAKTATKTK